MLSIITLTIVLSVDAWPSSAAFDLIAQALKEESERKDAIKKGGAIFAFTLKNDQGETADWYVDLKETGTVGKGSAPKGKKANGMSPNIDTPANGLEEEMRTLDGALRDFHLENTYADAHERVAVTMILSDVDWAKLISGKANAQKLFMSGKLKIKGDVMKATKIEPILKKVQSQDWAKL